MCLFGHLLPRIISYLFYLFLFVFYFSEFNSIGRKLSISGPLIAAIPKKRVLTCGDAKFRSEFDLRTMAY